MSFLIQENPIEIQLERKHLEDPYSGALVEFDGRVRNHHQGQKVQHLVYEIYASMALKVGQKIIEEALSKWTIQKAYAIHRYGHLEIGESAVYVGVCSAHRQEAFEACQYIIQEIKHRCPIFKKETYLTGESQWVGCERCAHPHTHTQKGNQHESRQHTSTTT